MVPFLSDEKFILCHKYPGNLHKTNNTTVFFIISTIKQALRLFATIITITKISLYDDAIYSVADPQCKQWKSAEE